ncbi:MAG: hypothetical protein K2K81_09885 [Muribaculaceae bacterium]|nr:hypothetical protein [Muribaculaceae bacterium]
MKYIKLIFALTLAYAVSSCGAKNPSANKAERKEKEIVTVDSGINPQDYSDLIKTVYSKFVCAIDADPEVYAHPERYFTENALKKLKDGYEFDCEDNNCYAFNELRTQEQDSKPGTTGESDILNIESVGDDWYIVKYSDMGWTGITRIKIVNGKIDDFQRCVENL